MAGRAISSAAVLRRAGIVDPSRAAEHLTNLAEVFPHVATHASEYLHEVADPDLAVLQGLRLAEACTAAQQRADVDETWQRHPRRVWGILGGSAALGDFLVTHPEYVSDLAYRESPWTTSSDTVRGVLLDAIGADGEAPIPVATEDDPVPAMRIAYRRHLLVIAAEDLAHPHPTDIMPRVSEALSDLADAALEASLAIARSQVPEHAQAQLAMIAMGKTGARELNYVSDVDVVYVADAAPHADKDSAMEIATALATTAARVCDAPGSEPALWAVDAALRPEGRDGPLVRDVVSHAAYYREWAATWEFQALLKARPAAGDRALGRAYIKALAPLVWEASSRDNFVADAQAMRTRVEENIALAEQDRHIKLGPGGLRDVEFTVQLLQLVHGRMDTTLHVARTLDALQALRDGGYVGRPDAERLSSAYRQLRVLEHRLQAYRMKRTHVMPTEEAARRRLARGARLGQIEDLDHVWTTTTREVRALHLDMFYRPLLPVTASLTAEEARLSPEAAQERLTALGFADAAAAQRHLAALTKGVSRRAAIQRQVLPAMMGWIAQGADPDAGLLAFRNVSDQLRDSSWFLTLLRDSRTAGERLGALLSTAPYVTTALLASTESITWLDSDEELTPRSRERLSAEADAILSRSDDAVQCITALRNVRRRELVRAAAANVLGIVDSVSAARAVTLAADIVVQGALRIACHEVALRNGQSQLPFDMAVVAMGRYGGMEMGYVSDADVMYVYEPHQGADEDDCHRAARKVAEECALLLQRPLSQPPLAVDADLRPEGRSGPLARSLESFREYYARWSEPWEAQALLRCRTVAGNEGLREKFVSLIDGVRYPTHVTDDALDHMRRLKARMESERLPRGVDPRRHLKLGPGGLSDVEWVVQLVQLRHAHEVPSLRTSVTLEALHAAVEADLVDASDAATLEAAWRAATELRGAIALRGRPAHAVDVMPTAAHELRALAAIVGQGRTGEEEDDNWARLARRCRRVMERLFYEWEEKR